MASLVLSWTGGEAQASCRGRPLELERRLWLAISQRRLSYWLLEDGLLSYQEVGLRLAGQPGVQCVLHSNLPFLCVSWCYAHTKTASGRPGANTIAEGHASVSPTRHTSPTPKGKFCPVWVEDGLPAACAGGKLFGFVVPQVSSPPESCPKMA